MKRVETKRKRTLKRKKDYRASAMIMLIVVVFCMFSSVLVFQRNMINELDSEINTLQDDYNMAVRINEDLEGELLSAKNLQEIETYAVDTLGMIQGGNNKITYVAYGENAQQLATGTEPETLFAWVSNLFR